MKRYGWVLAVVTVLGGLGATATADERTDKAVKELDEQFAQVKSYTAQTEALTDIEFGPGHTQKTLMRGTTEWLRKGEKALMRAETKCETTKTEDGKTVTTPSTITVVDDAEFLYALTEEGDQKTVIKSKSNAAHMYQPKGYFEQFRSYFDIRLLKEDSVNGDACYVFEMKMKPMEGAPPSGRQLVYFQKAHGIQVKSEAFDGNGKLMSSSLSKDVKVNVDIGAERFAFKIPAGAQVTDTTASQEQPAEEESTQTPEKKEEKGIKLPKWPKRP